MGISVFSTYFHVFRGVWKPHIIRESGNTPVGAAFVIQSRFGRFQSDRLDFWKSFKNGKNVRKNEMPTIPQLSFAMKSSNQPFVSEKSKVEIWIFMTNFPPVNPWIMKHLLQALHSLKLFWCNKNSRASSVCLSAKQMYKMYNYSDNMAQPQRVNLCKPRSSKS